MGDVVVLLTMEEVAARLRMTVPAARWQRQRGNFPRALRIGRRLMFRESDVEEYVQSRLEQAS